MSLLEEYKQQSAWRDWKTALDLCPIVPGQRVLDLGCGPGTIAELLVQRGAQVVGVDSNEELLEEARKLNLKDSIFLNQNLNSLELDMAQFDGIWCSFSAAYFVDFESVLHRWLPYLQEDGWICLVEMDDLFGHEPLPEKTKQKFQEFYKESFSIQRYDFRSGHKLKDVLIRAGFSVEENLLSDQELSFEGPANPSVFKAWDNRLGRMIALQKFLGDDFGSIKAELLYCLGSKDHRSSCKVYCLNGVRAKRSLQHIKK